MLLKVIETGAIRKLVCGFIFVFYSNCGVYVAVVRYSASKNSVTSKTELHINFKVTENGTI